MAASAANTGIFAHKLANGSLGLVARNRVKFMSFVEPNSGPSPALGAGAACSCSIMIILSDHGAILAHLDLEIGERGHGSPVSQEAKDFMNDVEGLFLKWRQYFQDDSHPYVVYILLQTGPSMPDEVEHCRARLRDLKIPIISTHSYERTRSHLEDLNRNDGTVLVTKAPGYRPRIYLEDEDVTPDHDSVLTAASQANIAL